MPLLPVAEALARILDGASPLETEDVAIHFARGRMLSADLAATLTQPPFDASAMDGYAVRAADVAALPARLDVVGEAAAGKAFAGVVGPGQAVRIFTGAPVPAGANAIVIQENVRASGTSIAVEDGTPDPAHIRPRGGDFTAGQILLRAGDRLDARTLTLAAAMGHGVLPVRRRPVVAIVATGNELVLPGTPPGPDQIVCSNPYGIAAMVEGAGGEARFIGIARDEPQDLAGKIAAAAGADVIVTIGGASVGDHDLVAPVLQSRGMTLDFWKIAMRPGKPLMFGRLAAARVIGLPGNPVSSLICTRVFIVPLVRRLAGRDDGDPARVRAMLGVDLPANGPRAHYMRARRENNGAGPSRAFPMPNQDSSLMAPLAAADCLIVREVGAPALAMGSEVDVLALDF